MAAIPTPNLSWDNFFSTTLASTMTATDTTIYLNSLPVANEGFLVIDKGSSSREIIYFTSKGSNFVTCPSIADGRGQGGTSASSHTSGATVERNVVAEDLKALQSGTALSSGAITAAKLPYGFLRSRQGGTTGDATWYTPGTSNTDTSAKAVFWQAGMAQGSASADVSITFANAFSQVPIVTATVASATGSNASAQIVSISTTGFTFRTHRNSDNAYASEQCSWIAVGQ